MVRKLRGLGERLLGRLVPAATAAADECWWEGCGGNPCLARQCCITNEVCYCGQCSWEC